jgi:hypothetical protein
MDGFGSAFALIGTIAFLTGAAIGLLHGCDAGKRDGRAEFVRKHQETPYCMAATVVDREYKRCFKAVEVAP